MTGIVLYGYGTIGQRLENEIRSTDGFRVAGIFDMDREDRLGFADVVVECSTPEEHDDALEYAVENGLPFVCGTTSLCEYQMEDMMAASEEIPIMYACDNTGENFVADALAAATQIRREPGFYSFNESIKHKKI